MKIIVENSTWNNVGDAFYQFPLYEILKSILKEDDVFMFDGPFSRAFRPNNFFKKNAFDIRSILDADVYVFSGPILGRGFIDQYGEIIKYIKKNKKNFMILSSFGDSKYKNESIEFLMEYSPFAFSSRTDRTFEIFSKISKNSYNGVCNAFFISKTVPTINLNIKNYLISSFYSMPELIIDFNLKANKIELDTVKVKKRKNYLGRASRHFDFLRKYPSHIKNKKIIRTLHGITHKFSHLNFGRKNSYLSFNPLNYLPLYKNCELTISDRVHACVAALSFDNPAMLIGDWGERAELFNKFDLQKINNIFLPNLSKQIDREYENYITWLIKVFNYLK